MQVLTLILAAVPILSQDFEVPPRTIEWDELDALFDTRWSLPAQRSEGRDLLAEMQRLSVLRFRVQAEGEGRTVSFGDLVEEARPLDGPRRHAWFEELATRAPKLRADWGAGLSELLLDDHLHSKDWHPRRDHHHDGLLIADEWVLDGDLGAPWTELEVDVRMLQAAALFHADLKTIKEVEHDYRVYLSNVGSKYEEINPIRDRFVRGETPAGAPFSAVVIRFKSDLPFPFSGYSCTLRLLHGVDAEGALRTEIYSTSSDFHYLAGRDVFLPVETSSGEVVAYLVVRHFGFDLDGVPDKRKHRLEALRTSFGNLKRNSEARFSASEHRFVEPAQAVVGYRVLGSR